MAPRDPRASALPAPGPAPSPSPSPHSETAPEWFRALPAAQRPERLPRGVRFGPRAGEYLNERASDRKSRRSPDDTIGFRVALSADESPR